jgi:hypothetical protein
LPREQRQRRRMVVNQPAEQFGGHHKIRRRSNEVIPQKNHTPELAVLLISP